MANASIIRNPSIYNLETGKIQDYVVKPTIEATKWLTKGFMPWGSPVWHREESTLYQAFVKPEQILFDKKLKGKQAICRYLHDQGYKPGAIAKMLHLSPNTVSNYLYYARKSDNKG